MVAIYKELDVFKVPEVFKLDVGCGHKKKDGFFGIDKYDKEGVDFCVDLDEDGIPFPDNSVDEIYCSHCAEHLNHPEKLLSEIARVMKEDAILVFRVPYWSSNEAFFLSHKFQFSEKWLEEAFRCRGFCGIVYSYGWTQEIQDPANPFHIYWKNIKTRDWCRKHLTNVVWEVQVKCMWKK